MKRTALSLAAGAVLVLSACGSSDSTSSENSDAPTVVASFYPAAFVAERVGGDLIELETLTSPGADAHELELTARQIVSISEADVLVYLSEFQAAVDSAIAQTDRSDQSTVDLASNVASLDAAHSEHTSEADADDHDHAHDEDDHAHEEDEHAHEEEATTDEDHSHAGHDHGDTDPHLWLDPTNLEPAVAATVAALSAADPDNADTYQDNGDDLLDELSTLDEEFTEGLAVCERRDFVTSHAAFAYLANAYDLHQVPIAGIDPQSEPSSAQLAQITDLVNDNGITTVFTEPLSSSALAETIARETGATTATLDPIEGLSDESAEEDYLSLMRANLAALQEANNCS